MHLMIPEKWLTSTPSSLAEGIINKDIPAVNRARQEIKAATSNIGAFNTVFHMLVHGRSSMQWATRMSNQSTSPVSNVPTVIDRTTETANLDFDIMFESIKLAVGIKAPTVCYPLCSDFTDGFRYVNLTVSQIQKLFESGLVVFHRFILIWIFGRSRSDDSTIIACGLWRKRYGLEGLLPSFRQSWSCCRRAST